MKNVFIKKELNLLLCILLVISLLPLGAQAKEKEYFWYIKRNGGQQPYETEESRLVELFGGYYVDKKVSSDQGGKKIYLTFDAGYENGNVKRILDVLKEKNVKGAFFILNNLILKNTDLVVRMATEGHLVCNHTNNHKNICSYDKEEIKRDLSAIEQLYEQKTGLKMSKYFRFPEGKFSERALEYVNELGYTSVFWSLAYDDWDNARQPSPEKAMAKLLKYTHNGAIILLHPTSETNATILPVLIDEWRNRGYEFGTLDEL